MSRHHFEIACSSESSVSSREPEQQREQHLSSSSSTSINQPAVTDEHKSQSVEKYENNSSTNSQVNVNAQSSTSTNQQNVNQSPIIPAVTNEKTDNIQEILVNTDSDSSDNLSNKDSDIVNENLPNESKHSSRSTTPSFANSNFQAKVPEICVESATKETSEKPPTMAVRVLTESDSDSSNSS